MVEQVERSQKKKLKKKLAVKGKALLRSSKANAILATRLGILPRIAKMYLNLENPRMLSMLLRPQQGNMMSSSQKPQEVVEAPAAMQTQKKQESADDHHQILEKKENPFKKLAIRCSNPVLESSGGEEYASKFSTTNKLRKRDKDLMRNVMFEDYGF
ncbi:hypothetical protein ACH5RR_002981 [Cinchona calisaya]|uniref:Uncharacterized protein n=1 Tax=Cinchona calisaya TaxID=153742 RepID=A0ABD3ATH8_9GENT